MCPLSPDQSVVLDRESDQEKSLDPLRSPDSMPALRLVAPQGRPLVLHLRASMEYVRHRRSVPGVPPPVDFDPMC